MVVVAIVTIALNFLSASVNGVILYTSPMRSLSGIDVAHTYFRSTAVEQGTASISAS